VQVEGCGQKPVVPATGDIVTLRILSVNPRFAKVPLCGNVIEIHYALYSFYFSVPVPQDL
jgi:hypothetical protein